MRIFEGKSLRQRRAIGGSIAAATAGAVILTSALVPMAASAAPGDHSEARSQFLSGSILTGIDLDSIVGLAGTEAINTGAGTVTDTTDLDVTALSALNVTIPSGASIPLGDLLALGAVNQFSQAQDAGVSRAASGAVSDAGIVDTSGTGTFPASASLDLMALLPSTPLLTEANLTLSGVTGVAALDAAQTPPAVACADISAPVDCRGYNIAGATTNLELPAVGAIATTTQSTLGTLSTTLNGLSDELLDGLLGGVTGALSAINALLPGVSLVSNDLDVTITANLASALDPILSQDITVSGVTLNAAAGTVTVDWENIAGLNGLPPNTPLISNATLSTVATNAAAALTQLQTELNTALAAVTDSVNVQISGGVCLLEVVLVGCTAGLDLSFNGSLADLLDGSAPLGVSGTGLASVLSPILGTLTTTIQGATSTVLLPLVNGALSTAGTAISNVVAAAAPALSGVFDLLGDVVSVDVNVQEDDVDGPGTFTEVAARVTLLGGSALTVDLGKAIVGANEVAAVAPTVDALDPVQAGTSLPVTGANWVPGSQVTLTLRDASNNTIGTPVVVTVEPDGTLPAGTVYAVPTVTPAGTDYVLTATDNEDPQNTATDTVAITAAGTGDVNTNAAASASASADATADGDPSAQAAAEAAAFSDATAIASAAATADAEAAAEAAATVTASSEASTTADADVNASAAVAAQAAAQADASDDVNAAASTAAEANSSTSSEAAATTTSSADASNEASANTNATASATASANADASTAAVAEAAAQAAAYAEAESDASAAADIDASAAAETAATATSSTAATADATSAANAGAAIAAQAAALADATSNTAADTSATSDASTSAASNASAAAIATASTTASADAVAEATSTATAAADPDATATASAEVSTNASASAAASAQADDDSNASVEVAAQAAALADATNDTNAAADVTANSAAQAAATTAASADAATTATSEANAAAAASAQAAAQTDATSTSAADTSASADADPNAAASIAANATSSNTASATAAADATATATSTATASATTSATASASANANPTGKLGITVKVPVLERGQQQTTVGTGFKPGEVVTGVMTSDPLALGTQVANAQGTVTFTWAIPAGTDLGTHTVTLTGAESGSVAGTFQVVAKGLAATGGTAPNGWIVLGALLLMFGLGTALVARSKRETVTAE